MGLLTSALAGFAEGAANTGAALMVQNQNAAIQAERDKALAIRQQNLEELRQKYQTSREDIKDSRLQQAEQRKADATLTDYQDAEGMPMTRGQVIAAAKLKQDAKKAEASATDRANTTNIEEAQADALEAERPDARTQINDAMGIPRPEPKGLLGTREPEYTPEEQATIEKASGTEVKNSKALEAALKRKEEADAKLEQIRENNEMRKYITDSSNAMRRETAADRKASGGGSSGQVAARSAAFTKKVDQATRARVVSLRAEGKLDKEAISLINDARTAERLPALSLTKGIEAKPSESKPAEKPKPKGILSTVASGGKSYAGNPFGSTYVEPARANTVPNPMLPTPASAPAGKRQAGGLPPGTVFIGMSKKTGGPAYRLPNGKIIAGPAQ